MPKGPSVKASTKEETVAKQPTFSFMAGRRVEKAPRNSGKASGAEALRKLVLDVMAKQRGYAELKIADKELPNMEGSSKTVSTWFYQKADGSWGSRIRYGQQAVKIDGEDGIHIGKLEDIPAFYDDVAAAIHKGELDTLLKALQDEKGKGLADAHARRRAEKEAKEKAEREAKEKAETQAANTNNEQQEAAE